MNFDGLTFLTALVLYSQSDYLNHSNRDSDWLIVACFMRVKSMLTTLLFALEIKFVLKIESNSWGKDYSTTSRLVSCFPPTLLSCFSRFLRALQQNSAQSRLLYLLNRRKARFFLTRLVTITFLN